MEHIDRIATSSSSDGERAAKPTNLAQQGSALIAQNLPSPPSLKCPRCDSSNTKFCYYNNYSQTQPRHFCKSCRRYWTQGGTLRNVPVGGGCRKNKRVRPRSLISLGGLDDGSTPFSDTTSNMLGRLGSIPNFGNVSDDTSSQLLNIAYRRFQESMHLRQQSAQSSEGMHYSDMSLPALVHKPCGISSCTGGGACSNRTSLHLETTCAGAGGFMSMDAFENNLGFTALHADQAGYCNNNYEMSLNPALYAQTHNLMGTSATATLASIEDELSNFSNLAYHVNSVNTNAAQEQRGFNLPMGASQRMISVPSTLDHGGSGVSYMGNLTQSVNADLRPNAHAEDSEAIKDEEKTLISMGGENGLSLMMPAENWQQQQPTSMNEGLFEPHHGIMWSTNAPRWQEMHPTSVL
ncbi:hypothetical protein GOP47_0015106 [Adiantum capillus-veneris]|uniref:Dof-type domain-containing protein n=1 Tax=Adiantum capillus-veneris TaxID=13818 RepID=A0A9D4ZCS6_ADICA|nr:hypothetical protein GOP47_0015106 [Adiantum capillus-veneris]